MLTDLFAAGEIADPAERQAAKAAAFKALGTLLRYRGRIEREHGARHGGAGEPAPAPPRRVPWRDRANPSRPCPRPLRRRGCRPRSPQSPPPPCDRHAPSRRPLPCDANPSPPPP